MFFQRLKKYNGLRAISDSLRKDSYNISKCGISDLRHFLYKNKSTAQYTSPELEAPYLTSDQQERLFGLYHYLHNRIHSSSRPLKILYHVGQYEALLGWVRIFSYQYLGQSHHFYKKKQAVWKCSQVMILKVSCFQELHVSVSRGPALVLIFLH